MAYSKSPKVIEKVRVYLDQMVAANSNLTWHTTDPRFAHAIWNAFNFAKKHELKPYDNLASKYKIRVHDGKVVAELRVLSAFLVPQSQVKLTLEDVTTLQGIIGACIAHKSSNELFFPNCPLIENEIISLYTWLKSQHIDFFIISHEEAGITLTTTDPGEIKWLPPQVTQEFSL